MSVKTTQICKKTVMDSTDRDITFDKNGVCHYVDQYKQWEASLDKINRQDVLNEMIDKIKKEGKKKKYDCIMGLSGGVDSSYLAHLAVKEWGLRPLIVHVDSGWNSELAVNNIENIMSKLNIDLHTLVIDWPSIKSLQRSFFKASVPNCDIPQDHAFIAGLLKETKKFGIRHLLNGGNMATESILPNSWGHDASDLVHLKSINRSFENISLKKYPTISFFDKYVYYPYIKRLTTHRPLELIDYNKESAKKFLMDEYSWRDYGGKHYESLFTRLFQSYYLPEKFNFDKRKAHLSSLIVSGQMTRKEALNELKQPLYNTNELERDLNYFTKKLNFSKTEWNEIMNTVPKLHEDYQIDRKPEKLKKLIVFLKSLLNG